MKDERVKGKTTGPKRKSERGAKLCLGEILSMRRDQREKEGREEILKRGGLKDERFRRAGRSVFT